MRDFVLLTAICIAIVVGVAWLLLPGSPADFFRSKITVHAETPDPPDTEVAAPEPPRERVVRVSPLHAGLESAHASSAAAAPVAPTPVTPPSLPISAFASLPLPWDVLPGEPRSEVVDNYGAPSLSTSTQDSGHLYETYVYRSSGTQAIVHLEDGRVSRVSLKGSLGPARP